MSLKGDLGSTWIANDRYCKELLERRYKTGVWKQSGTNVKRMVKRKKKNACIPNPNPPLRTAGRRCPRGPRSTGVRGRCAP
jgi:hypothetical protein